MRTAVSQFYERSYFRRQAAEGRWVLPVRKRQLALAVVSCRSCSIAKQKPGRRLRSRRLRGSHAATADGRKAGLIFNRVDSAHSPYCLEMGGGTAW